MRVLIVEDDVTVLRWAAMVLEEDGFVVDRARTADEGRTLGLSFEYDLALVDLDLPDGNGLTLVIAMRRAGRTMPILIMTGRDDEAAVIAGLDAGADDYLVKPLANGVLRARLRAALRRGGASRTEDLSLGALEMNRLRRTARLSGKELSLTPREFALLEHFLLHPREVVARSDLLERVWGVQSDTGTNVVDATVSRLRQKLTTSDGLPSLRAVRGVGYVLTDAPEVRAES